MKPLVIIPARTGSKGVPDKNFRALPNGESLVTMAAEVGLQVGGRVIITTDHPQLAGKVWERRGRMIEGLIRPAALCGDAVPMQPVIEHVLRVVRGSPLEPVILLQPTSPERTVTMVRKCLKIVKAGGRAATVAKIPDKYARAMPLLFSGVVELPPRRQEVGAKYIFTGDCYAFQRGGGWPADQLWQAVIVNETLNIDTPADWLKFNESLRRVRV